MERIYSARLVYKNYFEFILSKLKNHIVLAVPFIFLTTIVLINITFKALLISIEKKEMAFVSKEYFLDQFNSNLYLIPLVFGIYIIFSSGMWFQKFCVRHNKLVDLFPNRKEFNISDIEKIVLFSPNLAQIHIKQPSSKIIHSLYWYGKNETDWVDFINLISIQHVDLRDKIFVNTKKWHAGELKKSSQNESYSEILNIYKRR